MSYAPPPPPRIMQALVGDRYGYRPFPATIPLKEFQTLLDIGLANGVCTRILSMWYKLDYNTVPKVFQLIPITEHYPNYSSKETVLREADRGGWWKTFLSIQGTFWTLAKIAVAEGKITEERAHTYLQSSEQESSMHVMLLLVAHCT